MRARPRSATASTAAREAAAARGRPRAGPLRRLVRAVPALVGRPEGRSRRRSPTIAELGFDVLYLLPIHPIGLNEPQGPQQHARGRPRRSRLAVRDRRGRGRPRRRAPRARHDRRRRARCRGRARSTAWTSRLDFAINASADHPWLTEHPEWFQQRPDGTLKYAENPPKSYQDIYNFNWEHAGLAGAVGRVAARSSCSGSTHGVKCLPRRQPAHEAVRVLGVADRRGPQGRPRRGLPRRGVHPPRGDARAGQARLHAVLHVLHVEELAPRADRVRQRARPHGRGAEYFRPNFFPVTPDILHAYLVARRPAGVRHPARARRRR